VLLTATNLAAPTLWSPVANPVQNTGPLLNVTLPRDLSRFYRLRSN